MSFLLVRLRDQPFPQQALTRILHSRCQMEASDSSFQGMFLRQQEIHLFAHSLFLAALESKIQRSAPSYQVLIGFFFSGRQMAALNCSSHFMYSLRLGSHLSTRNLHFVSA
jgi:hypothetical protein